MLYWSTVNEALKKSLLVLMNAKELSEFRLVGGTALSLHVKQFTRFKMVAL